ncbi:MAG: hypothetical protein IT442_10600 [Phycisphaeraceae bacterium]|nr:hypothetical protein [Phycisphaeraceae bacterium]
MRRKIVWCTFWLTVVMWFGRAWADMPVPATEPATATTMAATEPAATAPSPTIEPAPSPAKAQAPATLPATRRSPLSERKPAPPHPQEVLTNPNFQDGRVTPTLDRSHWPAVTVGPESGKTYHRPVYFRDLNFDLRSSRSRKKAAPERDFLAALGNARSEDLVGLNNLAHGFVEPLKFCADLAVLAPAQAVIQPPFITVTSP